MFYLSRAKGSEKRLNLQISTAATLLILLMHVNLLLIVFFVIFAKFLMSNLKIIYNEEILRSASN